MTVAAVKPRPIVLNLPKPAFLSDVHRILGSIRQETDAIFFNEVLNDPAVYPAIKGNLEGPIDATVIVETPGNVVLAGEHGCILFVHHQPGFYEAHTQVLENGRGWWSVMFVRAALHWLFTRTDAVDVATRCPHGNRPALALAKKIGGRFRFTNPRGWVKDGAQIPADIYGLSIADWMAGAPGLAERGHWFHEKLEAMYALHGAVDASPHQDDDVHDRYVGAAAEMILGGQPHKAACFYNAWAAMADYAPLAIVKDTTPVTIDIGDALLIVRPDGNFWMPACKKPKLKELH